VYIPKAQLTEEQQLLLPTTEILKEEIFAFESQIAQLEQQNAQSPILLRLLRKWLVFGPVKKLEWIRFKLHLKQKDLLSKIAYYNQTEKLVAH
jgi:hypothetical protein